MSDKYGYIGIETLLNFCSNDKNHCITPNDFMRMNRVKIDERPHGNWEYLKEHITDMRDADGESKLTQKQICQFILNLMSVIEEEGEAE